MKASVVVFGLGLIAVIAAVPVEDPVIAKLEGDGTRFQYMSGPNGPELVDLWLKASDVIKIGGYNPQESNRYVIFTRNNPKGEVIQIGSEESLRNSNYDASKKTVILTHGWLNTPESEFNVELVSAYIDAEDVNVIMVDWSVGAAPSYLIAMYNVIKSAEHVGKFVKWLLEASNGDVSQLHIIGHSLGAHLAGIVGRDLGGKVPYLTGLDPAMPGWITHEQAIDKDVALYTEIIHTDVGLSGILSPAGHVDFYPNGGRQMPGCPDRSCDHHKCVYYMAESLRSGGFTGARCDSLLAALSGQCNDADTLKMGGTEPKPGSSGIFHLDTNAESPLSKF